MDLSNINKLSDVEFVKERLIVRAVNKNEVRPTEAFINAVDGIDDIYLSIGILMNEDYINDPGLEIARPSVDQLFVMTDGMDPDYIYMKACENTMRLFPPAFIDFTGGVGSLEDIRGKITTFMDQTCIFFHDPMYLCITNLYQTNGATSIFLPGVMETLSEMLHEDLFITFTSRHEAMVHPVSQSPDPTVLSEILKDPLFTTEETFLSDKVYYYDKGSKTIRMVHLEEDDIVNIKEGVYIMCIP